MMKVERFKDGEALTPKRLNELLDEISRLRNLTAVDPLRIETSDASGLRVSFTQPTLTKFAFSPATGTPGIAGRSGSTPGSATCTLATWNGTSFVNGSETETVKNAYLASVGNSKVMVIFLWEGDWWAESWDC